MCKEASNRRSHIVASRVYKKTTILGLNINSKEQKQPISKLYIPLENLNII